MIRTEGDLYVTLRDLGKEDLAQGRRVVYDYAGVAYDYKFVRNPGRGLRQRQIRKILREGPASLSRVEEINP